MRRALLLPLCLACLACVPAAEARDYGQQGAVFPVIERDLLEQIHTRLTSMEKSGETKRLNQELQRRTAARVNRPEPVAGITSASETRVWRFDPTITVERDIADDKGRVIIAAARGLIHSILSRCVRPLSFSTAMTRPNSPGRRSATGPHAQNSSWFAAPRSNS